MVRLHGLGQNVCHRESQLRTFLTGRNLNPLVGIAFWVNSCAVFRADRSVVPGTWGYLGRNVAYLHVYSPLMCRARTQLSLCGPEMFRRVARIFAKDFEMPWGYCIREFMPL